MRKLILLLLSIVLILASCELFTDEPAVGDVYAIMVGLDYKNNADQDNLKGTLNDVDELHIVFGKMAEKTDSDYFGYTFRQEGLAYTSAVNHSIGTNTVNSYPSMANIEHAINALINVTDDNDLILFTYSGHGGEDGSIALAKTSASDESYFYQPQNVLDLFTTVKGRKLIILDTCFSGLSLPDNPGSSNTVLGSSIDEWYAKYWENSTYVLPDMYVLTASADTLSYEIDLDPSISADHRHGLFTAGLLKALGWGHPHPNPDTLQIPPAAKESVLTVDSLYGYILDFIEEHPDFNPQWTILKLNETKQHPLVSGGAMDMVLFRF
ncbi:caspase family protein [Sphaerochaeta sp.]|uniref:caspase family protein n=1 Tax=Sphaerochaeta sp. TaxID=1972642 RepID=UPI002583C445|nr:caspase family protein [Sphaerochaeta sp.]MDD3457422.1 caspase family protein [Sphaerochaeta sp.]